MASAEMQPIRSLELLIQQVLDGQKDTRYRVDDLAQKYHDGHAAVLARIARREVDTMQSLAELDKALAKHHQEFDDFKRIRDRNGSPGMCAEHETDIEVLKIAQAQSAGRREVWMIMLLAVIIPILMQLFVGEARKLEAHGKPSAIHLPTAVDSYGMIDGH